MPYKLAGKTVMVLKSGRWQPLKEHETEAKARAHLAALNINVMGKGKAWAAKIPKKKKG